MRSAHVGAPILAENDLPSENIDRSFHITFKGKKTKGLYFVASTRWERDILFNGLVDILILKNN